MKEKKTNSSDGVDPPMCRVPWIRCFDGVRVCYCFSVILLHSYIYLSLYTTPDLDNRVLQKSLVFPFISHLSIQVDVFFLLSGFLLALKLSSMENHGRAIPSFPRRLLLLLDICVRRLIRLYPAVVVSLILGNLLASVPWTLDLDVLTLSLPFHSGSGFLADPTTFSLRHLWSFVVDVYVYCSICVVAILIFRLRRIPKRFVALFIFCGLLWRFYTLHSERISIADFRGSVHYSVPRADIVNLWRALYSDPMYAFSGSAQEQFSMKNISQVGFDALLDGEIEGVYRRNGVVRESGEYYFRHIYMQPMLRFTPFLVGMYWYYAETSSKLREKTKFSSHYFRRFLLYISALVVAIPFFPQIPEGDVEPFDHSQLALRIESVASSNSSSSGTFGNEERFVPPTSLLLFTTAFRTVFVMCLAYILSSMMALERCEAVRQPLNSPKVARNGTVDPYAQRGQCREVSTESARGDREKASMGSIQKACTSPGNAVEPLSHDRRRRTGTDAFLQSLCALLSSPRLSKLSALSYTIYCVHFPVVRLIHLHLLPALLSWVADSYFHLEFRPESVTVCMLFAVSFPLSVCVSIAVSALVNRYMEIPMKRSADRMWNTIYCGVLGGERDGEHSSKGT